MNLFRNNRWTRTCLLPLLLLLTSACASAGDQAKPWVEVGGERFMVEIADDDAERADRDAMEETRRRITEAAPDEHCVLRLCHHLRHAANFGIVFQNPLHQTRYFREFR